MGQISGVIKEKDQAMLYKMFANMDKNKNGELDQKELFSSGALRDDPVVQRILQLFDKNGNGSISYKELVEALTVVLAGSDNTRKVEFAFRFYDFDGDNYVSYNDLVSVTTLMAGNSLNDQQVKELVTRTFQLSACADPRRGFTFQEFVNITTPLKIIDKMTVDFK